jgi:transposase
MSEQESRMKLMAELFLKVRSGELSAKKAASMLNMSRKTYYKWEKRALRGMLDGLAEKQVGRPELPPEDPEKLALKAEVEQLKAENLRLQKQLEVKDAFHRLQLESLEDKKKEE